MPECSRCGKCCFMPSEKAEGALVACPKLVHHAGRYFCRVYKNRLGRIIGHYKGVALKCCVYNSLSNEIEGCPLNGGEKPVRVVTIDSKNPRLAFQHTNI